MWSVRLRLAAFRNKGRYTLVGLAPPVSPTTDPDAADLPSGVYRGPAVDLLLPLGVNRSEQVLLPLGVEGKLVAVGQQQNQAWGVLRALGVLEVPGLLEGRPCVLVGDTIYIRPTQQPQHEYAALVAAVDGTTCFILFPPEFWMLPSVEPLVRSCSQLMDGNAFMSGILACEARSSRCCRSPGYSVRLRGRTLYLLMPPCLMAAAMYDSGRTQ